MTAPALALDAFCGSPACHGHRCPRVRHGYVRGEMRGKCSQHRHCRAFELDELAELAELEVPDVPTAPATDETTGGRALEAEAADRPADPATPDVTGQVAEDSPAGAADAATEVAPRLPDHDLPGTDPAAEAGLPRAFAADGQLLHRGHTWWCPRCLNGRELPKARCCGTPLIAAETIVRRRVDA